MSPFLAILLWPLQVFAFNPVLCGILAGAYTIPVFVSFYSLKSRFALACCALPWWAFCLREASVDPDALRTDLVVAGPLLMAAALVGAWHLVRGHRRVTTPAEAPRRRPLPWQG